MVAGEASGDLLASLLLHGLRDQWPQLTAAGIGGPQMLGQGFDAWWPSSKLSVFGYVDALRHLPELLSIRRHLRNRVLVQRPDVFIGVDAPDFNFGLETSLKAQGVRTVHFVCPSIWAWRGERVKQLEAAADHVLCLFPFEPALLAEHGVAATYVGHPLADRIPLDVDQPGARQALGLSLDTKVVALLPGSRRSELSYIGPSVLKAAQLMASERAGLQFVLPVAPGLRPQLDTLLASMHLQEIDLRVVEGRSHEVLAACDVTLIASGTATLEAALYKRPMVITYRLHPLNWWYMKRKAYQPWVGLPNVLLKDFAVPELLQDEATPEALAEQALAWLDDQPRCERLRARFRELHITLRQDTARQASHAIAQILGT
jgi:lipid-A-disaccharide synthase